MVTVGWLVSVVEVRLEVVFGGLLRGLKFGDSEGLGRKVPILLKLLLQVVGRALCPIQVLHGSRVDVADANP